MVSKKGEDSSNLAVKLSRLEEKITKLNAQVNENKQLIQELKLIISQRDSRIHELELKLGFAQQSLLEQATHKIQDCRNLIKSDLETKVVTPTVTQIQQCIKTAQKFIDDAKSELIKKKTSLESNILTAKEVALRAPDQAKIYVEKNIVTPAQSFLNEALITFNAQVKTTRALVEDKIIYPGKVNFAEIQAVAQNLPMKLMVLIEANVIEPLTHANNKTASVVKSIYPDTLNYLFKTSRYINDITNQTLIEITALVKNSPFWDGKSRIKSH